MSGHPRSSRAIPCLPLALLLAASALAAPSARAATVHVVAGSDLAFTPRNVTIQAGDTVMWSNSSGFPHNVHADDGSFRCANGCDGAGGDGTPSGSWSFSRTFNGAGTIAYHCEIHGGAGSVGMSGTITVQTVSTPGALKLSSGTYNAGEGAGHATIVVERSGGQSGAASVHYATSDGTGKAGLDYTAASGTLSWADGDGANKTFSVPILDRHLTGPTRNVNLALSSSSGAALGSPATAVLNIADNTGSGGGTPPAAPTALQAATQSTSAIQLGWHEASSGISEFHVEQQSLGGSFQEIGTVPGGTLSDLVSGLDPATFYSFRVRAANASGFSPYSNVAGTATDAAPSTCTGGPTTLCVGAGGRFKVEVTFASATQSGAGNAVPIPSAPESGLFYFFNAGNIEMLVKVLNACGAPFNRYWVFYAATTNVEFTLTVTDTQSGKVKVYFNPLNQVAAPAQDTDAFATCP